MTPTQRAKIKALAEDERGDPKIRATAQRMLKLHPEATPRQKVVPGMERSPEYLRFLFMDLNQWKPTRSKKAYHYILSYSGTVYKFVLHEFNPGWSWKRVSIGGLTVASQIFDTCAEALKDAWSSLQTN